MSIQNVIEDSDIIEGLDLRYLKFFGLWEAVNYFRTTGNRNVVIKFSVFISFVLAVPYTSFQFLSYFFIKVDLQKATFLNLNMLIAVQLCCRILVFWLRTESISTLFNLLRKDFLVIPENKQKPLAKLYKKISRTSNLYCFTYVVLNFFVVILYIFDPDISVDYILKHTGNMYAVNTGRKKILGGWYPFPMDQSPYFEYIFIYEVICVIWPIFLLTIYFCLYFQVLFCLYAQFVALGYHMETFDFEKSGDKMISDTIRDLFKDHQKLLRYSEDLRSVYNPMVTVNLGIGILVLIMAAMQFIMEFFSALGVSFVDGITTFMLETKGILLWIFLIGQSSDLQFGIYKSKWYKADITTRKALQIMMVRAKRRVGLTALRMYPVNRETLMNILQLTYSCSTVMSRMTEEK